ncbi:hypothetical protein [Nocardia barduliensis]|uniref:hypothetical protein n=1 Tax=Nocardia barduliensis TaxID=2736643 RepID=UPI00157310B3|nr:hypothetical protein [Nocardia barduliensis]
MQLRHSRETTFRAKLAAWVVGLSLAAISALSALVVIMAASDDRARVSQLVFSAVLPLFGTWVGTVLAFYFARENFEAATQSTLRLSGGYKKDDLVSDVMIRREQMIVRSSTGSESTGAIPLESIASIIAITGKKRVPILDDKGAVKYVVHKSLLDSYARTVTPEDYGRATLEELLANVENKRFAEAIGFVSITATAGEARDQMQRVSECNDVFVTSSGYPAEPVLGWLTNNLLASLE